MFSQQEESQSSQEQTESGMSKKDKYKVMRMTLGTQREAAVKLGVSECTIRNREKGRTAITQEAFIAMYWHWKRQTKSE